MLGAQSSERFKGRLSRLPVDRPTAPQLRGQGSVEATLNGDELVLTAKFEGLSSPATAAHIHRAPVARRGPVAFTVEVPAVATGELRDTITLTNAQLEGYVRLDPECSGPIVRRRHELGFHGGRRQSGQGIMTGRTLLCRVNDINQGNWHHRQRLGEADQIDLLTLERHHRHG